ncbi:hypothetical protein H0H87_010859 [Tephrocybe sp. NHM501043]|nr:hypothetical protein H0H87_010859 [Tephrocybe sp. NHM501043]
MPEKRVDDVTISPNVPAYTPSEQGLTSPTNSVASTKEELEVAAGQPSIAHANAPGFPEGGIQAWFTVLGGTIVTFCTFGVVQSFGVYQDYYTVSSYASIPPANDESSTEDIS